MGSIVSEYTKYIIEKGKYVFQQENDSVCGGGCKHTGLHHPFESIRALLL